MRTKHHAPETNGVVERFYESLKYEHLYRLEIATGHDLAQELGSCRQLFNEVRPHEHLDFATPLTAYLSPPESNLSEAENVQKLDPGQSIKRRIPNLGHCAFEDVTV